MYKKRPDLIYSLSYHPLTDGKIAKWLLTLQDMFEADNILAGLGTLVSKYRAGLVHSTSDEIIKKTKIENGYTYFGDSTLYKKWEKGFHPLTVFTKGGLKWSKIYTRILYQGSVNIMAFDKIFKKMPKFLQKCYYNKLYELIKKLKEVDIKVNIFDIVSKSALENLFKNTPNWNWTVYSSNPELVKKQQN